jgi:hypothetical protein
MRRMRKLIGVWAGHIILAYCGTCYEDYNIIQSELKLWFRLVINDGNNDGHLSADGFLVRPDWW